MVQQALDRREIACAYSQTVKEAQQIWREGRRVVSAEAEAGLPDREAIHESPDARIADYALACRPDIRVLFGEVQHGSQGHEAGGRLFTAKQRRSRIRGQQ
ncbi:MAG: hypothetical protein A2V99_17970 [Spirochaetes bacterium RBG_16_67_19]|nr:MAG: hypothetical protein A2V99_17970 [Spirochaetes bacterium RBG_16_67_19]